MLKRGQITIDQASAAIEIYEQIPLNLVGVDLQQALKIVGQHNIYAYDAYMIACALNLDCPIITLDGGLSYAAKAAGVEILEVK